MATLTLCTDCSQLATIREFVAQVGRDWGLEKQVIDDLQLAVDEACTNIVVHAYDGQPGEIEVEVKITDKGVWVITRDWGKAFDPEAIPMPDVTAPLEERQLGGLGLYLMRQVMDEVQFKFDTETGNTLTMFKRLQGKGGE
jgi:serine/threonine-protein kinase RsbW